MEQAGIYVSVSRLFAERVRRVERAHTYFGVSDYFLRIVFSVLYICSVAALQCIYAWIGWGFD